MLQSRLELRFLAAAARVEFEQEWGQAEERARQQNTAITILDVGRGYDGVQQKTLRIYQDMALLARDFLAGVVAMGVDRGSPLERAEGIRTLDALATNNSVGGAFVSFGQLAAFHAERIMDATARAVIVPMDESSFPVLRAAKSLV